MSLLSDEIPALLKRYKVRPRKKHGQSFLKDQSIAREIVETAEISEHDRVLEIGGGLGILTELLVRVAKHVFVIEIDPGLVKALEDKFTECENLTIIHGDALKVAFPEVSKVVSNLPYSISSEITFRLLHELDFDDAVLMYQKEFAQRLQATPGSSEYSRLSVNIGYQAEVENLLDVPKNMFYPEPAVDSVVVRLKHSNRIPRAKSDDIFFWMINGIFSYPNKNLRKAMRIWFRNLGVDKSLVNIAIDRCRNKLDGQEKLRTLSIESLVALSDSISSLVEENSLPRPEGSHHE